MEGGCLNNYSVFSHCRTLQFAATTFSCTSTSAGTSRKSILDISRSITFHITHRYLHTLARTFTRRASHPTSDYDIQIARLNSLLSDTRRHEVTFQAAKEATMVKILGEAYEIPDDTTLHSATPGPSSPHKHQHSQANIFTPSPKKRPPPKRSPLILQKKRRVRTCFMATSLKTDDEA